MAEHYEKERKETALNKSAKFSLSSPVEETKDLIAVHNVSADNFRKILSIKGMAMPSIAII